MRELQPSLVKLASARAPESVTRSATAFAVRAASESARSTATTDATLAGASKSFAWYSTLAHFLLEELAPADTRRLRGITRLIISCPCAEFQPLLRKLLHYLHKEIEPGIGDGVLLAFDIACGFPSSMHPAAGSGADEMLGFAVGAELTDGLGEADQDVHGPSTVEAFANDVRVLVQAGESRGGVERVDGRQGMWRVDKDPRWDVVPIGVLPSGAIGSLDVPPRRHAQSTESGASISRKGRSGDMDMDVGERATKRHRECGGTSGNAAFFAAISDSISLL
jgi:hypothetical protein